MKELRVHTHGFGNNGRKKMSKQTKDEWEATGIIRLTFFVKSDLTGDWKEQQRSEKGEREKEGVMFDLAISHPLRKLRKLRW